MGNEKGMKVETAAQQDDIKRSLVVCRSQEREPRLQPKSLGKQAAYKRMTQRGASPASLKNLGIPASSPILALAASLGGNHCVKRNISSLSCFERSNIGSLHPALSSAGCIQAKVMKNFKMQARTDEKKLAPN